MSYNTAQMKVNATPQPQAVTPTGQPIAIRNVAQMPTAQGMKSVVTTSERPLQG